MTHAEITKADRKGFASECKGHLVILGTFPDSTLGPDGEEVHRAVSVYGCQCEQILAATSDGEVLNAYFRPAPTPLPIDGRD